LADFLLQSDKMALNKSKSLYYLGQHCLVYGACFAFLDPVFGLVNGLAHFIADGLSSKVTSRLWQAGERHWFFTVIGLDQAIHLTVLITTYQYLVLN
jgi:hypothetical protein